MKKSLILCGLLAYLFVCTLDLITGHFRIYGDAYLIGFPRLAIIHPRKSSIFWQNWQNTLYPLLKMDS
jgi:hypothetical protein